MGAVITESEAYATLSRWCEQNGLTPSVGGDGWTATELPERRLWVIVPPRRGNTVFLVLADQVRPVHRSRERLVEVIESLAPRA